jgi:quercetin dioxygenase-like cupin family protein
MVMRRISLLAVACALFVLVAVLSSQTSLATAPSGFSANFTYRATLPPLHSASNDYKVDQKNAQDIVMRELTIVPGGSSGWHFHPGPTYVIVAQGTDSLYEANDPTCTAHNYGPGTGFVELAGDVHDSRNAGTTDLVLFVTFMDVPIGGAFRFDAPRPGNCPF